MRVKKLVHLLICMSLAACASLDEPPVFRVTRTVFQGEMSELRGTIDVQPIDKAQASSLEFKSASDYLKMKLQQVGYVLDSRKPQYVAYMTYGIDNGNTSTTMIPIIGQTSGGYGYSSGTVTNSSGGVASYSGSSFTMPTYGAVGAVPIQSTLYKRELNIDIFRVDNKQLVKVYEIRTISRGSCGNISSTFNELLDGTFQNFPGINGVQQTTLIPSRGLCRL